MIHCHVCGAGTEGGTRWVPDKHQSLCLRCEIAMPPKMTRSEFGLLYWGPGFEAKVPSSTQAEFYEDYLTSNLSFRQYVLSTTSLD